MKKTFLSLACAAAFTFAAHAQTAVSDSLGLPGDNLDLAGVLDLFKQSTSPEDFEKKLNDPASEVNNLDLNEDSEVDYIRVVDNTEGDAHALVLQVPVSETEAQDVAVIELEKTGEATADVQVVGDEELYGENYIVEAAAEETGKSTGQWQEFRPGVVVVNVWLWPSVRFIYAPAYVVWVSPWKWRHYPVWYKPWRPVAWHVHRARVVRYHAHYHCVGHHRVMRAHGVYRPHRMASPVVHRRYEAAHQRHAARKAPARAGGQQKAGGQQHKNGGQQHKGGKAGPGQKHGNAPKGGQKGGGGKKQGPKGGKR